MRRALKSLEDYERYLTPETKDLLEKAKAAVRSGKKLTREMLKQLCRGVYETQVILPRIENYNKADLSLLMDVTFFEDVDMEVRLDILDHLKKYRDISAEDLITYGYIEEEARYNYFFFGLFREDAADTAAALLELSYRLNQHGTSLAQANFQYQQQFFEQQQILFNYLGFQAAMASIEMYNTASSAIRYDGATSALKNYESVPSDYLPYNTENIVQHDSGFGQAAKHGSGSGSAASNIVGTNHNAIKPTQDVLNPQRVAEYAGQLESGTILPPVEVVNIPGRGMYILDGHHRYAASQLTGIPVEINVVEGVGPIGMSDWSNVQWKDYISEAQFWD
jgi:hypothetical protein